MILDIKNGTNTTSVNATYSTPNFYNATNIANNSTNTTNWNVPATVNQCNVSATSEWVMWCVCVRARMKQGGGGDLIIVAQSKPKVCYKS